MRKYSNLYLKGIKGEESALNLKKKILRYSALSYTLLMSSISEPMEKKFMDINRPDILIEKNLVTKEEIESLRDDKVCTINIQYVYDKSDVPSFAGSK